MTLTMLALLCGIFGLGWGIGGLLTLWVARKRINLVSGVMFGAGFELGRSGQFTNAMEAVEAFKKSAELAKSRKA